MGNKPITDEEILKFWKDNRTDREYTLTGAEVRDKFIAYVKTKEMSWLEYYLTNCTVRSFVGEKQGLSSVMESDHMYERLVEFLRETFWETVEEMKQPSGEVLSDEEMMRRQVAEWEQDDKAAEEWWDLSTPEKRTSLLRFIDLPDMYNFVGCKMAQLTEYQQREIKIALKSL